jgi:hypothetical protein
LPDSALPRVGLSFTFDIFWTKTRLQLSLPLDPSAPLPVFVHLCGCLLCCLGGSKDHLVLTNQTRTHSFFSLLSTALTTQNGGIISKTAHHQHQILFESLV